VFSYIKVHRFLTSFINVQSSTLHVSAGFFLKHFLKSLLTLFFTLCCHPISA
jgi:hypothetical protein